MDHNHPRWWEKLGGHIIINRRGYRRLAQTLGLLLVVASVSAAGAWGVRYHQSLSHQPAAIVQPVSNKYSDFVEEVYQKILNNYWQKISESDLSNLFAKATEKVTTQPQTLSSPDQAGVMAMINKTLEATSEDQKAATIAQVVDVVLANLQPFGRSRLYTKHQETDLRNTVQNIDPTTNLYNTLGIEKTASASAITKAYQEKLKSVQDAPDADQQKAQLNRAYQALSEPAQRQIYDESGAEPTVIAKQLSPSVAYLKFTKVAPTAFEELKTAVNVIPDEPGLDSLIIDLRGNMGGAIDLLPYLMGPFVGPNQYAYDFFHQSDYVPYRTKTDWLPSLVKYKKVVILTDKQTQSSAEVMAAVFKRFHVGVLVGTTAKGWGTVEQLMPLEHQMSDQEQYSILLVHSLTLRDDSQPIENRGVEPNISIENPRWPTELKSYINDTALIEAVRSLVISY